MWICLVLYQVLRNKNCGKANDSLNSRNFWNFVVVEEQMACTSALGLNSEEFLWRIGIF